MIKRAPPLIVLLLAVRPAVGLADGNASKQAAELAAARADLDRLEAKLQRQRAEDTAKTKALLGQKGQLEQLLQREQTRLAELRRRYRTARARRGEVDARVDRLVAPVAEAIGQVRRAVETTLPYRRSERLAKLDELARRLKLRRVTPASATAQLWRFVEDELQLAGEVAIDRQAIALDGKRVLADVARVGMVALYFRTADNRFGRAERAGRGYRYRTVDGAARAGLVELFEALDKQIRSGLFALPLPPVAGDEKESSK